MDQGNKDMDGDEDLFGGDDNQNGLDHNYSIGGDMMTSGMINVDQHMSNPAF